MTVLFDTDTPPPENQDYSKELEESKEAEFDVARALKFLGYDFHLLGFHNNVQTVLTGLQEQKPDAVFNLSEAFKGDAALDYTVASVLEMLEIPYTGSPPRALQITRDKALTKKVLSFHGINVPEFFVARIGEKVNRPKEIEFPLIVKPLREDASLGIAQSSIVRDDKTLKERVRYIHDKLYDHAIAEKLIVGREIYLGLLGNDPVKPLTPIEMVFREEENEEFRIATYRAKWSAQYRKDKGIQNIARKKMPTEILDTLNQAGTLSYKALQLRDYARIDMRLTKDNEVFVLEANPNPFIARLEDFADAADWSNIPYTKLIDAILQSAIQRG